MGQKKYNDGMSVEFPTCKRAEEVMGCLLVGPTFDRWSD